MNLRPYQQQLITDIRLQYQLGHRRVLAVLPTGGGKTVAFTHIAQQAAKKGNRVCVLVHRQELLDQASRAMPMPHGCIRAGRSMDLSHAVQVASVQTLARRLHLIPPEFFQLIIVDEAHHTNAGTWRKVIEHCASAHLLGVTATPCRTDGRGLGEWYQAMVQGPSAQWLTDEGYLANARVLAPPGFDAKGLRKQMGDYAPKEAEQRVGTIMGDIVGHYRKHLSGQTAIAFCCSVAHAEAVAALFVSAGVPAASIDGSMDAANRRQLLTDLAIGRIKVLTSCSLIGEGVDVPSVGGCILLRPTASESLHLQMIGRCLRPSGSKVAVVLDHVGNTLRLGHHLEQRDWSLDGLTRKDRDQAPSVKVCPVCYSTSMSAAQVCRDCGHVFAPQEQRELKQVDGELQEIKNITKFSPGALVIHKPTGDKWYIGNIMPKNNHDYHSFYEEKNYNVELSANLYKYQFQALKAGNGGFSFKEVDDMDKAKEWIRCDISDLDLSQYRKREQGKASSLEALRELAQQRGYKRGWAERVYQARLAKRHGMA